MAAQELGIPYDQFLAIWKTKGKVPLVPASTPTHPVVAAAVQAPKVSEAATAALKSAQKLDNDLEELYQAYAKGDIDKSDFADGVEYIYGNLGDYAGVSLSDATKAIIKVEKKAQAVGSAAAPAPVVPTAPAVTGGLDYSTVKAAYDLMKKQMPGATPATLRKAAAKHLGIDYNDFLKAWKNKPGKVVKSQPAGAPTGPAPVAASSPTGPNVIPLNPTSVGKYANSDISLDGLKDELARLFGPQANKSYINPTWVSSSGSYTVQFPSSILSPAGKEAVKQGLEKLGLKVVKKGNDYTITPGKPRIPKPGEFTKLDADGNRVINMAEAQRRTDDWWKDLDQDTREAWNFYTGSGYSQLNRQLRGLDTLSPANRRRAERLSKSMENVEDEFTVVRGGGYDLDDFKDKKRWTSDGFTSTAASGGFGGNVRFVITVTKGTRGRWIGRKSMHPGEKEFLLDKGTQFRITLVDDGKKPPVVHLTTIPKK